MCAEIETIINHFIQAKIQNMFNLKQYRTVLCLFGTLSMVGLNSCEKSTMEPVDETVTPGELKYPLFVEYWGVLPEYKIADFGLVKAEDVPEGTDIVHLFVFDKSKGSDGTWKITNRFDSEYNMPIQKEEIPVTIVDGIRLIQDRGIRVIFSIFTPKVVDAQDADLFAKTCLAFTEKWKLDGVEIDLEGEPTSTHLLPALGKYFGPKANNGKILAVVDYNQYNISHIKNANQYLDYVNTMSYWNTSSEIAAVLKPYADAMGDAKKVLIGVGGGPAITPGQATPRGEEIKIAQWLKANSPGTGMMNFIMDADYAVKKTDGSISRSMAYSQGIIANLKPQ